MYYGDGATTPVGNWNLSKAVTFGVVSPASRWSNSCGVASYDGTVDTLGTLDTFRDEATARAELAKRC